MRYFFNVAGAVNEPDTDGHELGCLADARTQAVKFAAEYLRDSPELIWLGEEFRVEVTDEKKRVLFTFIALGVDGQAQPGRLRL